jgi:hypothetical protein
MSRAASMSSGTMDSIISCSDVLADAVEQDIEAIILFSSLKIGTATETTPKSSSPSMEEK